MLGSLFKKTNTSQDYRQTLTLDLGERSVEVNVRHNARARRYTLRLPQASGGPVLTIPKNGNYEEAVDFALRHVDWLKERLSDRVAPVCFEPGITIPVRGVDHVLRHEDKARGVIYQMSGQERAVVVPGDPAHFERRMTDWLKRLAREDIEKACTRHAANLGLHYRSISIRDQRTRWGSCSSGGRLNFSWRLILAPPEILDYVAAHEVAHLEEMNHQPQFWALVKKTCPEMNKHRRWLKANGAALHTFG